MALTADASAHMAAASPLVDAALALKDAAVAFLDAASKQTHNTSCQQFPAIPTLTDERCSKFSAFRSLLCGGCLSNF